MAYLPAEKWRPGRGKKAAFRFFRQTPPATEQAETDAGYSGRRGHSETEKGAAGRPVPPYSPAGPKLYQA